MTYPEFKRRLMVLVDFYRRQTTSGKLLEKALGQNSHFIFEFGHELAEEYMDQLAEAVGDNSNWIAYWMWECDMGKKEMGWSKKNGPMIRMKTTKDLWNTIKTDQ